MTSQRAVRAGRHPRRRDLRDHRRRAAPARAHRRNARRSRRSAAWTCATSSSSTTTSFSTCARASSSSTTRIGFASSTSRPSSISAATRGSPSSELAAVSADLAEQLRAWRAHGAAVDARTFTSGDGSTTVKPHFAPLGGGRDGGVVIFLEDTSLIAERVQQAKLAALGRLEREHRARDPQPDRRDEPRGPAARASPRASAARSIGSRTSFA